jgi:hypothetical protein
VTDSLNHEIFVVLCISGMYRVFCKNTVAALLSNSHLTTALHPSSELSLATSRLGVTTSHKMQWG